MVKNLRVFSNSVLPVSKADVHAIVAYVKNHFDIRLHSLEISFVDSDELLRVNREHLQHDYRTDIITFSYGDDPSYLDGELLISVDDAFANAEKYHIPAREECIRLVIHGILHLIGYNDVTPGDKVKMELTQEMLIKDIIVHLKHR